MKRRLMIALALLVAVSCVQVQAAQSKSAWTVFKNSAKILVGSLFVFQSALIPAIDAATFDKEAALAVVRQARDADIAEIQDRGGLNAGFQMGMVRNHAAEIMARIEKRGTFGFWKLILTASGVSLIYSGYKGLTQEEEQKTQK